MNTFLVETFNRLFKSKSPAFFVRMRMVVGALTLANYLPAVLMRWFGAELPPGIVNLCEDIAKYCTGIFVALFLPASEPAAAQTSDGGKIQVTNEEKYPFSAAKEREKIEETVPPPPVIEPEILPPPADGDK